MASIVLTAATSTLGSGLLSATGIASGSILGSVGGAALGLAGRGLGQIADAGLSGVGLDINSDVGRVAGSALRAAGRDLGKLAEQQLSQPKIIGRPLSDLSIQTSTYGKTIPMVYGTSRVAGNIIWAQPIKESLETVGSGGKGGASTRQKQQRYIYTATLAVAIAEGEVEGVVRVWADAQAIDPNDYSGSYHFYTGSETQLPDAVLEAYEGVGNVPAYRGLSYVVIEDFPLSDYGNRIPNFTFEIRRPVQNVLSGNQSLEEMIKGVNMIPGSGEFVYDTEVQTKIPGQQVGAAWAQGGVQSVINQNNQSSKADALVALDQLGKVLPNLEWVGLVVNWFGDSLDAGSCTVKPGVEYASGAITAPDSWQVGAVTRDMAYVISTDANGNPTYGGTPSDVSIQRYVTELQSRGYKVLLLPMFFMDISGKPWRGRVTGSTSDVANFFVKTDGYNNFILHYANLVGADVDAFAIGSELIGLTKVRDTDNSFPAVDALVNLAASVRAIVGGGVTLTYAADWSEYHHTDEGWYNLDPLWASSDIDIVGIDAYFPLTDAPQQGYDLQAVMDGWTSGEGYDFYYADEARTNQQPLSAAYAWKNIEWWWKNTHTNPDSSPPGSPDPVPTATGWVPELKPIWFTEYGFPSVDGATNQPNVFHDPDSVESFFPRFSRGIVDQRAQRLGLEATEQVWKDSAMVPQRFIWTWDARPFPFWPDLTNVWADGRLWATGHWVQGKLGVSGLGAVVQALCLKAGLEVTKIDVSLLNDTLDGYVLDSQTTAKAAINALQQAYFFDGVERDGVLHFIPRRRDVTTQIASEMLIPDTEGQHLHLLQQTRLSEGVLPQQVSVTYLNRDSNYRIGMQSARRNVVASDERYTLNLPIVLSDQRARQVAELGLYHAWQERTEFRFHLPPLYGALEPTDVVEIVGNTAIYRLRVTGTELDGRGVLTVRAVTELAETYQLAAPEGDRESNTHVIQPVSETKAVFLDLPLLPGDAVDTGTLHVAVCGEADGWRGSVLYRSTDGGTSYQPVRDLQDAATIGTSLTVLPDGPTQIWDEAAELDVLLQQGSLESISEIAVLNGGNLASLGNEVLQFREVSYLGSNSYRLHGLLRGRLGTEHATAGHTAGESFVLLNTTVDALEIATDTIGLAREYKPVSVGATLANTAAKSVTYQAVVLKPYAPVHLAGTRDGSGNLTIRWVRRTRYGGQWRDGVDALLGEVSEAYEVEVMNGGSVIRTISGLNTMEASYSAAEQVTDFGSTQSSVLVRVYQLSAVVGRGYGVEGEV